MNKTDLKFDAEITFDSRKLESVPCEITFPDAQDERVLITIQLDSPIPRIPFIFALKATTSDSQGNLLTLISVSKIYNLGSTISYNSTNRSVSTLKAEPVDLRICRFLRQPDEQKNFYFWLTQSILLAPAYSTERHFNGNVSIDVVRTESFEIVEGLSFNFVDYYFYCDDPKRRNTTTSKSILAAEFVGVTDHELGDSISSGHRFIS